jgi:hypothetical protein
LTVLLYNGYNPLNYKIKMETVQQGVRNMYSHLSGAYGDTLYNSHSAPPGNPRSLSTLAANAVQKAFVLAEKRNIVLHGGYNSLAAAEAVATIGAHYGNVKADAALGALGIMLNPDNTYQLIETRPQISVSPSGDMLTLETYAILPETLDKMVRTGEGVIVPTVRYTVTSPNAIHMLSADLHRGSTVHRETTEEWVTRLLAASPKKEQLFYTAVAFPRRNFNQNGYAIE